MKKVIVSCLLGLGLLLPSIAAKSNVNKVVTIYVEGYALSANSDITSGPITGIAIYDDDNVLVMVQSASGYKAQVNLTGLPSDNYTAEVMCTKDKKYYPFTL